MAPQFKGSNNKVVVVTGGNVVLCSTMTEALAAQGARTAIDVDAASSSFQD